MTDIDMKNCHPVILLWLCDKFGIACPKLREYVERREPHLAELGNAQPGKNREACKRLFLVATNTNKKLTGISYPFFNEYQDEIQETIQPSLMVEDTLARFKPHAEEAARRREAGGDEANEEGSFLNLALCFSENVFLQEVKVCLDEMEIETAVLMLDGLMVYGDHYGRSDLLVTLHDRLKEKFGIDMYFDFKQHETTALDDMPAEFDMGSVLDAEWTGLMSNIDDDFLRDPTHMQRILSGCYGEGRREGTPITWEHAARKLWKRSGREEPAFQAAWKEAGLLCHSGDTLRHYSRASKEKQHTWICKKAIGLQGRTSFKEHELCEFFLKMVGDDVLCLEKRKDFCIWHHGRWQETDGAIIADLLMTLTHELFQSILSYYEKELSRLVADGEGGIDDAKKKRKQVAAIANTANAYGNSKNQNVLALVKNRLRSIARRDDPFDNQPHIFAFTNVAYDLTRKRGWFQPDKYDYLLMSCQKPWRQPTNVEMANVEKWYRDIQPNEEMRKALVSIHKSGLSGQQQQYFFVFTGGGGNGKDFLGDQYIHLLDKNGYACIGHLDLLTKPSRSGPNAEARNLHKKRFVRFAEPNPGEKMEAIRLSNVNELTGCESICARTLHEKDTDTHLHNTSIIECNKPPACIGDKGNSAQRRWRWLEFPTTFTANEADLKADPNTFKRIDPKLDDKAFVKSHYCALFQLLITAEGVWEPGESLDAYMPDTMKTMAKEYLTKNDELSTWFLEEYEHEVKTDSKGHVCNFVTFKEAFAAYKECDIFKYMKAEEKRTFGPKKLKADFQENIVLKQACVAASKFKLAATGKYNKQEGLIHYKRKRDGEQGDEGGAPSSQRPCMNAQFGGD